jgi:holliday junction DNA helicase RuvA
VIGWLRGEILRLDPPSHVLVNVGDVGYQLTVSTKHFANLVDGDVTDFHVHTHVRDDAIVLFGFASAAERATFELLLATPSVGPSTALGALSTMTPPQLAAAVAEEDVTRLATIPGIGRKTAARLVLELSGKLPSLDSRDDADARRRDVTSDLTAALRQLGYNAGEIREALRDVELPDGDEAALRVALRQLGRV